MALGYPELCAFSGGIKLLIDSVVDTQLADLSESIVYTLLYLMNESSHRNLINVYLDIPKIFSDFTDIDTQIESNDKSKS